MGRYRKYAQDQALYRLEEQAKAAKRGLWSLPEAERMPPWEWRHGGKSGSAYPDVGNASAHRPDHHRQRRFHLRQQAVLP